MWKILGWTVVAICWVCLFVQFLDSDISPMEFSVICFGSLLFSKLDAIKDKL